MVFRSLRSLLLPGLLLATGAMTGCSSMMAGRAVEQFTASVEAGDFDSLQSLASDRFAEAALPDESSMSAFDLVGLPVGEVTVNEITEVSDTARKVDCTVGEPPQRLIFDLVKDGETRSWTIDEITMKRGKGKAAVSKTVSEQMQLMLAVRDIVRQWQRDDLTDALETAEPLLAGSLEELPPTWKSQIAASYFGGVLRSAPKAKLTDGQARIDLSHKNGRLRLLLAEKGGSWKLRTAVLTEGRGSKVERDMRTEAKTLDVVGRFLAAMAEGDLEAATTAATKQLGRNTLARCDLKDATTPFGDIASAAYKLRQEATRTEVTIEHDGVTHQVTVRTADPAGEQTVDPLVEEITTYNPAGATRMSAELTARPTIELFHDSLMTGEIMTLKALATAKFDQSVWLNWNADRDDVLTRVILEPLTGVEPTFAWNGPQITATFNLPGTRVVYEMTSANQEVLVDDVLIGEPGQPGRSLRAELGVLLAMDELADGLVMGDTRSIRGASTKELNRVVWELQMPEDLPARLDLMPVLMQLPLDIKETPIDTIVSLIDCKLVLREDRGRLRIDDVIYTDTIGRERSRFATEVRRDRAANAIGAE